MRSFDIDAPMPAELLRAGMEKTTPAEVFDPRPEIVLTSGMIFIRQTTRGWIASFRGVKGMSPAELPLPGVFVVDSIGTVLDKVSKRWPNNWVLIAPL